MSLSVRRSTYRGKSGYSVCGGLPHFTARPPVRIFFEYKYQAREYVKRMKDAENSEDVLKDIWSRKVVPIQAREET